MRVLHFLLFLISVNGDSDLLKRIRGSASNFYGSLWNGLLRNITANMTLGNPTNTLPLRSNSKRQTPGDILEDTSKIVADYLDYIEDSNAEIAKAVFSANSKDSFKDMLLRREFSYQKCDQFNTSLPCVYVPVDVYDRSDEIKTEITWATNAMPKKLIANSPFPFAYITSPEGPITIYPSVSITFPLIYDPRMTAWYVRAASPMPKLVVIALDESGSALGLTLDVIKHSAFGLLDTLHEEDYVAMVQFQSSTKLLAENCPPFVRATYRNKETLRVLIESELKAEQIANFEALSEFATTLMSNGTSESHCEREKHLLVVTDGGDGIDSLSGGKNVEIEKFMVQPGPTCHSIPTKEAVRLEILKYLHSHTRPVDHIFYNPPGRRYWNKYSSTSISLVRPVLFENSKFYGVLGTDFEMSEISMRRTPWIGTDGYAFLRNDFGWLISHPVLEKMDYLGFKDHISVDWFDLDGNSSILEAMLNHDGVYQTETHLLRRLPGGYITYAPATVYSKAIKNNFLLGFVDFDKALDANMYTSYDGTFKKQIKNQISSFVQVHNLPKAKATIKSKIAKWPFCPKKIPKRELTMEKLLEVLNSAKNETIFKECFDKDDDFSKELFARLIRKQLDILLKLTLEIVKNIPNFANTIETFYVMQTNGLLTLFANANTTLSSFESYIDPKLSPLMQRMRVFLRQPETRLKAKNFLLVSFYRTPKTFGDIVCLEDAFPEEDDNDFAEHSSVMLSSANYADQTNDLLGLIGVKIPYNVFNDLFITSYSNIEQCLTGEYYCILLDEGGYVMSSANNTFVPGSWLGKDWPCIMEELISKGIYKRYQRVNPTCSCDDSSGEFAKSYSLPLQNFISSALAVIPQIISMQWWVMFSRLFYPSTSTEDYVEATEAFPTLCFLNESLVTFSFTDKYSQEWVGHCGASCNCSSIVPRKFATHRLISTNLAWVVVEASSSEESCRAECSLPDQYKREQHPLCNRTSYPRAENCVNASSVKEIYKERELCSSCRSTLSIFTILAIILLII